MQPDKQQPTTSGENPVLFVRARTFAFSDRIIRAAMKVIAEYPAAG